jgi:hypothetical protein
MNIIQNIRVSPLLAPCGTCPTQSRKAQIIICRYTFLCMRDVTATSTALTHLVRLGWPKTIENMRISPRGRHCHIIWPIQVVRYVKSKYPCCLCGCMHFWKPYHQENRYIGSHFLGLVYTIFLLKKLKIAIFLVENSYFGPQKRLETQIHPPPR